MVAGLHHVDSVDAYPPSHRPSLSVSSFDAHDQESVFDDDFLLHYSPVWLGRRPLSAHTPMRDKFVGEGLGDNLGWAG